MTWNLEWFYDEFDGDNYSQLAREQSAPDRDAWEWKRDFVARSIAEASPTIASFQEVENRRVLWYLSRSLDRNHSVDYEELCIQGADHFTEQDVGFLYRSPADLISQIQFGRTASMQKGDRYYNVSKHLMAVFEFPVGASAVERVSVMNVHLRSRPEGAPVRARQARLLRRWLAGMIERGENVILLGDLNTEAGADLLDNESEMAIASTGETTSELDDLVDLHSLILSGDTATHIVRGKAFDRIMVSRSLIENDPKRKDLVFDSIRVRPDLNVQNTPDDPEQHWHQYWKLPEDERDLSDHHPVIANFRVD